MRPASLLKSKGMIWLELVLAAFGGGILATLLDGWITHLRAFETARLQVLDDLDSMNAMSRTMDHLGLTDVEGALLRYPTGTWSANRAVMATRLQREDPQLLQRLSSIFTALALTPYTSPLTDPIAGDLESAYQGLLDVRVRSFAAALVYGPRYALRDERLRRRPQESASPGRVV